MTENLTKLPVKSILRKSSLTFIEHDETEIQVSLDNEKPTKVIVESTKTPPTENPEEERLRREEFEQKRKMNRHQEAIKVTKKLLSQEENIEENTEDEASEDALENKNENDYYYASTDDLTEDDIEPSIKA